MSQSNRFAPTVEEPLLCNYSSEPTATQPFRCLSQSYNQLLVLEKKLFDLSAHYFFSKTTTNFRNSDSEATFFCVILNFNQQAI